MQCVKERQPFGQSVAGGLEEGSSALGSALEGLIVFEVDHRGEQLQNDPARQGLLERR